MKKILILVNHDVVIYNFRKELVEKLLDDGYEVVISSPYGKRIDYLIKMGCKHINCKISRHGVNPFQDMKLLRSYVNLLKAEKPDVVLSYTIKPNIYGGIAARLAKVPFIPTITGLGGAMENRVIIKKLALLLYKISFKKASCVFFQNSKNLDFFQKNNVKFCKHKLIPGSGVNIEYFSFAEYPKDVGIINLLFVGRLMRDKGVNELIEAARIIRNKYNNVIFNLLGFCEDEYKYILDKANNIDCINYIGMKEDVRPFLRDCHGIILPSYHEGMANVLLEAASVGRPILASNIAGCNETFDEGVTGFGFEAKNVNSLVKCIKKFINLPYDSKKNMGMLGRAKMENEFNRIIVVDSYVKEINHLIRN